MQRPNSDYLPTPDYDELEERYKRQQAEAAEMATTPEDRANDTSMSVEQKSNGDLEAVQEQTQESEEPSSRDQQKARQREEGDDGMDNPVSQFLENSAVEVRDWIDDKIQGNQRSKEEILADRSEVRQKGRAKAAEIEDQIDNQTGLGAVYRDTTRAVLGAGEKQVQDVIGFGNLVGDTVKTRLGMVEEDDLYNNVDLPNYVGAERDMIIAEPKSQIGVAARDLIAFIGMSRRIGGAARSTGLVNTSNIIPAFGKATKAQKLTKFAADRGTEFVLGAIADLVMDPGDSNASNFIIEKIPGTAPFLGMFAIDEDDNEWEKRFKNTIEGGVLQEVVDVVGLGLRGLKAGGRQFKGWLKNNPGKKSTDAPVEVKAAAVKEYEDVIEQGLKEQEEFIQKSIDFRQGEMDLRAERQLDLDFNAGDFRKDIGDTNTGALKGDNIKAESNSVDYDEVMYRQNKDKWMDGQYTAPQLPGQNRTEYAGPIARPATPEVLDELTNNLASGGKAGIVEDIDTRGNGEFYHGSSSEIKALSDGVYEDANIYGQGFYTTEDLTTAFAYTKKGKGNSPTAYKVSEREPVKFFDLDQPAPDEVVETLWRSADYAEAVDVALSNFDDLSKVSVTKLFDEIRGYSKSTGTSRDTIQEVFESVQDIFRAKGYGGWTHKGGLLTKSGREHQVRIYWDPSNQLDITKVDSPKPKPQAPKQPANTRPGMAARATEQAFNGSRENGSPAKLEPHERAGRSSQYPVEEVGKEQAALKGRMPFDGRGTKPAMTDNLVRQFKAASNSDEAMNIIRETYDQGMADRIAKGLASTNPDVKAKAIEDLVMLNKAVDADAVESILMEQVKQGQFTKARIQQVQGQFVAKTYIVDIANQLADDGKIYGDLVANKQDAFHQAQGMLDKILVASKLQVEAISDAARVLQSSQNLGKAAPSPDSLKKLAKTSERVNDLKKRLEIGDRKAIDEMATLAKSFTLADGDPDLVQTFFEKFFELGNKNFQTVMYNAYLSGIKTQQRNILGGFVNIVMRPAEIAMGARIERDSDTARAALSMYSTMWDSLREGWQIGRTSWANWSPDNPLNKVSTDLSTAEKVRNLRAIANTPSEHAAATLINLQYNFMAHPVLQGPMRGLNAADAAFRAVSARQMTVYDMSKLAYEDGIAFNPEKFEQMWSTKMKDGRIVDERLLQYAKEDTFQEDLGKYMQATSNYIDQIPFVKFIVPFVKTPTNILKRTAHYTPLLGRGVSFVNTKLGTTFFKEYDAVMKGTDETAKAMYRGREATGALIGITFTGMGAMGLSTGTGPVTPAGRAAWKAAGIPTHSFQLPGGVWMSNRWLGPVGILMSLYADLGRIGADPGQYENGAKLFAAAGAVTAGALFEQSWLQGVTGIMAAIVDVQQEKADGFDPERWAVGVARGIIPHSAGIKNFNDTLTPGLREYDNYRSKLLAETIPFAKNFLGEEVISMWSGEPKVSKGMSALDQGQPFGFREVQNDPLLQKLLDLGVDFPAEFAYKYKGVELLKADKMAMHKLFSQTNLRKNLEKQLLTDSYIHDTNYKSWQDEQRPSPRRTSGWYKNITGQIQGAMDQAYEQYVNGDSPEGLELKRKVERVKHEKYLANRNKFNELQDLQSLSE